ncbi:hypothetical protein E4U21_007891 [Claviceps maximensis]|nr:hypothetical protein E4U21_007891 [Claviceps maximensis]
MRNAQADVKSRFRDSPSRASRTKASKCQRPMRSAGPPLPLQAWQAIWFSICQWRRQTADISNWSALSQSVFKLVFTGSGSPFVQTHDAAQSTKVKFPSPFNNRQSSQPPRPRVPPIISPSDQPTHPIPSTIPSHPIDLEHIHLRHVYVPESAQAERPCGVNLAAFPVDGLAANLIYLLFLG